MNGRRYLFLTASLCVTVMITAGCGSSSSSSSESGEAAGGKKSADKPLSTVKGVKSVTLVKPAANKGGGAESFSWKAAEGATSYRLTVLNAAGEPAWAATGTKTSAKVPAWRAIGKAGSWSVLALDADEHVIAASGSRKL